MKRSTRVTVFVIAFLFVLSIFAGMGWACGKGKAACQMAAKCPKAACSGCIKCPDKDGLYHVMGTIARVSGPIVTVEVERGVFVDALLMPKTRLCPSDLKLAQGTAVFMCFQQEGNQNLALGIHRQDTCPCKPCPCLAKICKMAAKCKNAKCKCIRCTCKNCKCDGTRCKCPNCRCVTKCPNPKCKCPGCKSGAKCPNPNCKCVKCTCKSCKCTSSTCKCKNCKCKSK